MSHRPKVVTQAKQPSSKAPSDPPGLAKAEVGILTQKIAEKIGKDPKKAAKLLTDWIQKSLKSRVKKAG